MTSGVPEERIEAAARVMWAADGAAPERFPFSDLPDVWAYREMARAATAAALAPLRTLHTPAARPDGLRGCAHCWNCREDTNALWPCATAHFIYAEDEL